MLFKYSSKYWSPTKLSKNELLSLDLVWLMVNLSKKLWLSGIFFFLLRSFSREQSDLPPAEKFYVSPVLLTCRERQVWLTCTAGLRLWRCTHTCVCDWCTLTQTRWCTRIVASSGTCALAFYGPESRLECYLCKKNVTCVRRTVPV